MQVLFDFLGANPAFHIIFCAEQQHKKDNLLQSGLKMYNQTNYKLIDIHLF